MEYKLGKQEYVPDERTLRLAEFVRPEIHVPATFDFDKSRTPFPIRVWGNGLYGDCVIGGRANHLLRLERLEQRRTIALYDEDAIALYKKLTGCQEPEDANDTGLVVLDAMRQWKNEGWDVDGKAKVRSPRNFKIVAYGELDPQDGNQLRQGTYALHGIHMGFWLPRAAQSMTANAHWDYNGESGPEWTPGSWGGHLVYSKAYIPDALEVLTWGQKVMVSNNFIEKYCDEAWAVVDSFDPWRVKQTIDVQKLQDTLGQITSRVNT